MTDPYRTRREDPPEFDPRERREVNPALWDLQLGWGTKRLSVRGLAILVLLGVTAVIVSNIYAANDLRAVVKEIAHISSAEHKAMAGANERLSCIVSLSPEDRLRLRMNYYHGAFARFCPWMSSE